MGWGPVETRWGADLQAYGAGVGMKGANRGRWIDPAIAAAISAGVVASHYSRVVESDAGDL